MHSVCVHVRVCVCVCVCVCKRVGRLGRTGIIGFGCCLALTVLVWAGRRGADAVGQREHGVCARHLLADVKRRRPPPPARRLIGIGGRVGRERVAVTAPHRRLLHRLAPPHRLFRRRRQRWASAHIAGYQRPLLLPRWALRRCQGSCACACACATHSGAGCCGSGSDSVVISRCSIALACGFAHLGCQLAQTLVHTSHQHHRPIVCLGPRRPARRQPLGQRLHNARQLLLRRPRLQQRPPTHPPRSDAQFMPRPGSVAPRPPSSMPWPW
jgi:hypothetical protein